jgi:hypothetical protein
MFQSEADERPANNGTRPLYYPLFVVKQLVRLSHGELGLGYTLDDLQGYIGCTRTWLMRQLCGRHNRYPRDPAHRRRHLYTAELRDELKALHDTETDQRQLLSARLKEGRRERRRVASRDRARRLAAARKTVRPGLTLSELSDRIGCTSRFWLLSQRTWLAAYLIPGVAGYPRYHDEVETELRRLWQLQQSKRTRSTSSDWDTRPLQPCYRIRLQLDTTDSWTERRLRLQRHRATLEVAANGRQNWLYPEEVFLELWMERIAGPPRR